jgi:hypothetical protein
MLPLHPTSPKGTPIPPCLRKSGAFWAVLCKKGSPGVYEVVRAWEEPGNPNPYLYVGRSGSESLAERIRLLVRLPAKESHAHAPGKSKAHEPRCVREKMIACAKEVLEVEDDTQVLPWLYIRWSVCDSTLELALLEYYLHFLRKPLFVERKVSAHTWSQVHRDDSLEKGNR